MMEPNPLPPPPPPQPRWLQSGFMLLLSAQLALLWLQGVQLNRQHQELSGIREDLQSLAETLDQNSNSPTHEDEGYVPARAKPGRSAYLRVRFQEDKQDGKSEEELAIEKNLAASRANEKKAIKDSNKVQSQLSYSENARIAEEKAKVKEVHAAWEMWALASGALFVGGLLLRGWLRSREK